MHPACPNKKQNHLQNCLLRRTQFWVSENLLKTGFAQKGLPSSWHDWSELTFHLRRKVRHWSIPTCLLSTSRTDELVDWQTTQLMMNDMSLSPLPKGCSQRVSNFHNMCAFRFHFWGRKVNWNQTSHARASSVPNLCFLLRHFFFPRVWPMSR